MPRKKNVPAYCHHRGSGQAYVKIDGRRIYLGKHGTPESHARYREELARWQAAKEAPSADVSVKHLSLLYAEHAKAYYQKNGKPTSELNLTKVALRFVNRECKDSPADAFTPAKLKNVRGKMIEAGYCRNTINAYVRRIVRAWKWGVSEGLVNVSTWQALTTVPGLRAGRTAARESDPVKPVKLEDVEAVKPYLPGPLQGAVEFQLCTAARPGETLQLRLADIDRGGEVWIYAPATHKTQHHQKSRVILIGPKAQAIVLQYANADPEAYVFGRTPDKPYEEDSYGAAIRRCCEVAFGMPEELRRLPRDADPELKQKAAEWRQKNCWRPNQLRHSAATAIRREAGIEAAQTILGHAEIRTSEIYAERDLQSAAEIIRKIG